MGRDDKYSSSGSDADYSKNPFKNADSPAVSNKQTTESGDAVEVDSNDESSPSSETEGALGVVTRNGLPYAMARSKVTDDREQKQFQLLKETRFELQDAVAELVKAYDDENLSETDALEIILRTGLAHANEYDAAAKSLGFGLENIEFSFSE